jgi:cytochrome c biogenesis protein CcmG/thiol:disulfide interchange protein DsbE
MRRAPDDGRHGRGHLTTSLDAPPSGAPGPDEPPSPRRRGRTVIVVAVVALAIAGAGWLLRPTSDPREEGGVAELDEPFPGLAGEAVVGPPLDTAALEWSVLVVNVWATWCEPCRREQPALQQVQASYEDRGVVFVGVDYRDDRAAAERWIEDFGVSYPSLYDPHGRTAATLGFPFLPDTYLVDATGTMRYAVYGETSAGELSGLIDDVLAAGGSAASS